MIAYLAGFIAEKKPNLVVLDVNGVGYSIGISLQCSSDLPDSGKQVKLFIHHHFTESDQRLFGFLDLTEKNLFEALITVKGVGPKMALTILSGLNSSELQQTIIRQDIVSLSRVPGIGRKTAERIVVELKDKLAAGVGVDLETGGTSNEKNEAAAALEALGYRRADAEKIVTDITRSNTYKSGNVSELVKLALKQLYK